MAPGPPTERSSSVGGPRATVITVNAGPSRRSLVPCGSGAGPAVTVRGLALGRPHGGSGGVGGARAVVVAVGAGAAPLGPWPRDPQIGGGRLIGEACHFVDLLRHLAG